MNHWDGSEWATNHWAAAHWDSVAPQLSTAVILHTHVPSHFDYGNRIIVKRKAFNVIATGIDPAANISLVANGQIVGTGTLFNANTVTFNGLNLTGGEYAIALQQQRDGLTTVSAPFACVRATCADSIIVHPDAPVIMPADGAQRNSPVTVTITTDLPDAKILYCVDGTGYAQPVERYKGPFQMYQSAVVKARVVYKGLKSNVTRTTIRVARG
jgi:hypothetical protein